MDTILVTKEAKNIARALGYGYAVEVKSLDKSKLEVKNEPRNKGKYNFYIDKLAFLQTIVLKHVSEVENKIAAWEKEFCLNNDFALPTSIDRQNSEVIKEFMDQLTYGKFMLENAWKIKF